MSLTINTKSYTSYRTQADSNLLAGPTHDVSSKDTITLRRQFPKPTKDSLGVGHPGVKFVRTLALSDGTRKDMIVDVPSSVPVGAATADILSVLADVATFLASQDAKDLFTKLDINA